MGIQENISAGQAKNARRDLMLELDQLDELLQKAEESRKRMSSLIAGALRELDRMEATCD